MILIISTMIFGVKMHVTQLTVIFVVHCVSKVKVFEFQRAKTNTALIVHISRDLCCDIQSSIRWNMGLMNPFIIYSSRNNDVMVFCAYLKEFLANQWLLMWKVHNLFFVPSGSRWIYLFMRAWRPPRISICTSVVWSFGDGGLLKHLQFPKVQTSIPSMFLRCGIGTCHVMLNCIHRNHDTSPVLTTVRSVFLAALSWIYLVFLRPNFRIQDSF